MKGRRSSRSAAVVLAGCVGLAVMAPGLALAAPLDGLTETECTSSIGTWNPDTDTCEELVTSGSGTTPGDTGSGSSSSSGSSEADSGNTDTSAGTPSVPETTPSVPVPSTPDTSNGADPDAVNPDAVNPDAVNPDAVNPDAVNPEAANPEAANPEAANPEAANPNAGVEDEAPEGTSDEETTVSDEEIKNGLPPVQGIIDDLLPAAGANPIRLPGLPTIPQPVDGTFNNVNDACLNAISQLEFPAGTSGLGNLSEQLQGFCRGLDTTDVHVCLEHLRDVVKHLCPTVIEYNTTINFVNTHVSYEWWGAYWTHRYDVDCDELTYDEANAILDWDRSDPFRLDRDDDGEACEANAHGDDVETVVYDSYPVGGVATGDGSTDSGASGVEVALAAGALGGLGVTGLTLVRRFARQG
ncbi:hypothetical protein [Actinomycetospora sp. CA-053990]|uniref:hypothetical protein n=1 Tax=Actinomycetospora sp. CA-053990 TaxID=3239891 RepID=UPI003D900B05